MKKAFVFVPLILGTIFILLLGGIGLEIIKSDEKISKAMEKIQRLKKEKNYELALEKLEDLENNFLVKYFAFKKEEIEKMIKETSKLLQETKIETKEREEDEGKEKEKEELKQREVVDCKNDLDCLMESAQNCTLSKVKDRISVKIGEWQADIFVFAEIRGKENKKCLFYVKVEKLYEFKKEGMSRKEIEKETEKWRKFVEGANELCYFENEDLVLWLEKLKEGILPSFERARCEKRVWELLQILK